MRRAGKNRTFFKRLDVIAQETVAPSRATIEALHDLRLDSRTFVRLPLHRPNRANGMSEIEGKVTRAGASERGQRTSFNGANGMSDIEHVATGNRAGRRQRS